MTNNGVEAGTPVFYIRLPFSPLAKSDYKASDYTLNIPGAACTELTYQLGGNTFISCTLNNLAPGESVTAEATITLPANTSIITYRICDEDFCDDEPYRVMNISVSAAKNDGGSGGGGSSFGYLLLLMLPVLLLRRKKH